MDFLDKLLVIVKDIDDPKAVELTAQYTQLDTLMHHLRVEQAAVEARVNAHIDVMNKMEAVMVQYFDATRGEAV